jgi:glycine cleavage system H protein
MADVKYTKDHEVVKIDGDIVSIGISEYAQDALGDLVFVELPDVGRTLDKKEDFAVVESVKTAAEVYTPVAGEVVEVNEALNDNLDLIKESIENGWIAKIKVSDAGMLAELMDEVAYKDYLASL